MVSIFQFRKKLIRYLNICSPVIAIILIYSFEVHPVEWLKSFFNPKFFENIKKSSTNLVVNQAIIILIFNIILEIFRYYGEFTINVQNKDRRKTTYLPLGQKQISKKIDIEVKVNYRNQLFKSIFNLLGGLNLYIHIPRWLSLEINNIDNFPPSAIDDSNIDYIVCDINNLIQKRAVKSNIYLSVSLISNATEFAEDQLISEIKPATKNRLKKILCYLIIIFFFDMEENYHDIISS
jgi:hypothetical protein